jgi:hypothetical protein
MGAGSSSERRRQQQQQQQQQVQTVPQQRPAQPAQTGPARAVPPPVQQYPAQQRPVQQTVPPPMMPFPAGGPQAQQPPAMGGAVSEAHTIKNECTVTAETVKYDAGRCVLMFETNCNIPCEMEMHVAVRVDVMHGNAMITPNKPKPPPPKISIAAGHNVPHEMPVDLTNVTEQELAFLPEYPKQFPIVLVLYYTATDDKTNHCAEYTMVSLRPTGKFLKQLLRTKAGVFKIESLFGGEHADVGTIIESPQTRGPVGGESPQPEGVMAGVVEDNDEEGLCVICLTNEKTTVVMPCRHLCLCKECAEELRQRSPKCPVCRGPIAQLVSVKS